MHMIINNYNRLIYYTKYNYVQVSGQDLDHDKQWKICFGKLYTQKGCDRMW